MSRPPSREAVLALHREALDAFGRMGAEFGDDPAAAPWHRTTVEDWSTMELLRHLVAVADWYHEWLDLSERGHADPPFPPGQLDYRSELEVLERRELDGPNALEEFLARAEHYLVRLHEAAADDAVWARPYGFPYGTTTVGLHAGAAATEWHLHLWDLAGGNWWPSRPGDLYLAAGAAMTSVQPRFKRIVTSPIVHWHAERQPWDSLLISSGRTPIGPRPYS